MLARPTLDDTWNDNFRPRFGGNMDKKNQTQALPVNRAALAKSRAKMEAELREKGLSTELDDSNKGFAMLQKMGYKKGENLGKNGSEGAVQEPIPFEVKNNRSGLGREALLKERAELEKRVKLALWNGTKGANRKPDPTRENPKNGQALINQDKKGADDELSYLRVPIAVVLPADDEVLARAERLAAFMAGEAVRVEMLLPNDRRLAPNGVPAGGAVSCQSSKKMSNINSAAITRLRSLCPGAVYTEAGKKGPDHKAVFTIVCKVGDKSFAGEGSSKKAAKIACAQKAVEAITGQKQQPDTARAQSKPITSTPRPQSPASLWNVPAKLIGKRTNDWLSIDVKDDGKIKAAKIGWKDTLELEVEGEGKSKKTGNEVFAMFKVGQKFRADAIRMSDDEEFTVTALYVELEVIDWTKLRAIDPNANSVPDKRSCGHMADNCGVQRCPWCQV